MINWRAWELCAGVKSGEIVLFDKGYVDFQHLRDLDERGVFWVTRAKDNLAYEVLKAPKSADPKILKDEVIRLSNPNQPAPELMRRIVALVEVDGQERELVFLTNNLKWSPRTVADLYRCRWQNESFFKQIKQTLQLADSSGAQRQRGALAGVDGPCWCICRCVTWSFGSKWAHSFTRLFTILRAVLRVQAGLVGLVDCYGTAKGSFRNLARPNK